MASYCRLAGVVTAVVAAALAVLLATLPRYEQPALYNPHCDGLKPVLSDRRVVTTSLSPVPFRVDCPPPIGAARLPFFTSEGSAGVSIGPWVAAAPPVTIDAPVADVWAVLLAFNEYESWNPFTPRITAPQLELGAPVKLCVLFSNRTERVVVPEGGGVTCDTVQEEYVSLLLPPDAADAAIAAVAWHQTPLWTPLLMQAERMQVVERVGGPGSMVSRCAVRG